MSAALRHRARHIAAAFAGLFCIVAPATAAASAPDAATVTGPTVSLDRPTVETDDRIVLTIDGFEARVVTIAVCGNDGLRGSTDCNNESSKGVRLDADGTSTTVQVGVARPPAPCPCIVRVFSRNNDEVATAPITITDVPTADTVAPPAGIGLDDSLGVALTPEETDMGIGGSLRYALGGRGTFDVTASVKNRSNTILTGLSVTGLVTRGGDQVATFDFAILEPLQPGTTWTQTVQVEVPAPSFGELDWAITVSRAGKTLDVTRTTDHSPWLLLVLAVVFVLDIALLMLRLITSRRARRRQEADAAEPDVEVRELIDA